MPENGDWRYRAACAPSSGVDPELFFPVGTSGPARVQAEEAKAICRKCNVIDQCLKWAMDTGQDAGIWGGMTEDERRAARGRASRIRRSAGKAAVDDTLGEVAN